MTPVIEMLPVRVLVGSNWSYYVAIAVVLLLAFILQPSKQSHVSAPFYKASKTKWMFSADTLVKESYDKFRDRVYQIKATEGTRTMIPASLIGELKGLPEDTLSASAAVDEVRESNRDDEICDTDVSQAMLSDYTKFCLGPHGDTLTFLIRSKLTQQLSRLVPRLKSELEFIIVQEFPECKDWTPVQAQPFMVRTIARLSGRAFVGPELGRTEEWMDTTINFAVHVFVAVVKLQFFPPWLRPIAQYFVSELGQIKRDLARGQAMLKPIIDERLQNAELDPGHQKPDDFIQWTVDALPDAQRNDYYLQTQLQLVLGAASIHTTSNLTTDCIFDLAAQPEIQEILRQEAQEILEDGGGWARKESMAKLKKMDSFMKESQRLAGNVTSFIRKVIKPIDLSDGTHLPSGTNLLAPQYGISHDDRYFPDPEVFDGLRFWKMRQLSDETANRHQFTSIGDTNMNFGLGKHACPGRFFAGNEIKLILAYLLLNYDIKLKDGETERPKPMMFMMSKTPNPTAEIMFRRRERSSSS
ncbi:cytochrome P450 [Pseudomassariella vexata]|uniref:Cytochrome P450 n=1 Tax=Pseudomassariella vexata TaxID=1141098 RepID=A0A1Y2EK49_9PEZI|nr:cytochrome P450 [Pseudomassariella vexata]ORY71919.1 cytochrome P450 [Pseudomassariella vexata]